MSAAPENKTCLTCAHLQTGTDSYSCGKRCWPKFAKLIASGAIRSHLLIARECPLYKQQTLTF